MGDEDGGLAGSNRRRPGNLTAAECCHIVRHMASGRVAGMERQTARLGRNNRTQVVTLPLPNIMRKSAPS